MEKGQIVKCIDFSEGESLTKGKTYVCIAGVDDKFHAMMIGPRGFVILDNDGRECYCIYPSCAFGVWEVVL